MHCREKAAMGAPAIRQGCGSTEQLAHCRFDCAVPVVGVDGTAHALNDDQVCAYCRVR